VNIVLQRKRGEEKYNRNYDMGRYEVSVLGVSNVKWTEQREIRGVDYNVIIQNSKVVTQAR
jgi:hypothetical protein